MMSDIPPDEVDSECLGDHSFEDALEPRHLIARSDAVLRAGTMMLGSGTSSLRVQELMRRAASALGLDELHASVSFTHITLTVQRGSIFRTQVAQVASPSVDAHRISMLQRLSLDMPERTTATELNAELDQIEKTPKLYPQWLLMILVPLACAAITVLTGGTWREVVAVLPAAMIAFAVHGWLTRAYINRLATVVVAAASASGLFVAVTAALNAAMGDVSPYAGAGFVCSSIFLIPGFPLVTGGLDLTRLDLSAGIPRVTYAAMVLLAMTIGIWVVAVLTPMSPVLAPAHIDPTWATWLVRALASFVAVVGWAMMFNAPVGAALASGGVAIIANLPRLAMLDAGIANHIATFIGCVIIGLACAVIGRAFGLEKIIMTVPTLLVSIPGSSALQALLYFDQADITLAMTHATHTLLVVIAMVAGLGAARMVTDPEWAFTGSPYAGHASRTARRR